MTPYGTRRRSTLKMAVPSADFAGLQQNDRLKTSFEVRWHGGFPDWLAFSSNTVMCFRTSVTLPLRKSISSEPQRDSRSASSINFSSFRSNSGFSIRLLSVFRTRGAIARSQACCWIEANSPQRATKISNSVHIEALAIYWVQNGVVFRKASREAP
jgi:hypothetical protein